MSTEPAPTKIVEAPPTWKDSAGRLWTIKLNLQLLDDVLATTGVDLVPEGKNVSSVTALLLNHRALGSVLWALTRDQAVRVQVPSNNGDAAHPLTEREFKQSLEADQLHEGWEAIVDAILFFIQSQSPGLAQATKEVIDAEVDVMEAGAQEILATLRSQEVSGAINDAAARLGKEMKEMTIAELAKPVTGWQG